MKKWIFPGLLILAIFFISCEKNQYSNSIIGKWQWIKSSVNAQDATVTAELYDTTHYIEFNTNGYYYVYNNSKKLIDSSRYELSSNDQYNSFILLDTSHPDYINVYRIKEDTLSIECPNCPGFIAWITYYIRLK